MGLSNNQNVIVRYALVKTIELKNMNDLEQYIEKEIIIPSAYIKILNIEGDSLKIKLIVGVYEDGTKENLIHTKRYEFVPDTDNESSNFIKQGYEYLKSLEEYAGSTDVLEDGQIL